MSDWKLELSRELTLAHKLCTYTQYWVIKRSEERFCWIWEQACMQGLQVTDSHCSIGLLIGDWWEP